MSYKIFPHTADGDQISVSFTYVEERDAFNSAIERLRRYIEEQNILEGHVENGFEFQTTLQYEAVSCHIGAAMKILGLSLLNAFSKNSVYLAKAWLSPAKREEIIRQAGEKRIFFNYEGRSYSVGMDAYKLNNIQLPDGRNIYVDTWFNSMPPTPVAFATPITRRKDAPSAKAKLWNLRGND
jgi:hypothetical protein